MRRTAIVIAVRVQLNELLELGAAIQRAVVVPQEAVEDFGQRVANGEEHENEEPNQRRQRRTNGKAITRTHRLWQNKKEIKKKAKIMDFFLSRF